MTAITTTSADYTPVDGFEPIGRILERVAAGWRLPDRAEIEHDRRILEQFLTPAIALQIASLPVVVIGEAAAPLKLRADAWLWRTSHLAADPPPPQPEPITWVDNLPAIRAWAAREEEDVA